MIKPISSDILVVELLNLGAGAGADLDSILWNSNLAQPAFVMMLAQLKCLNKPAVSIILILVLSLQDHS